MNLMRFNCGIVVCCLLAGLMVGCQKSDRPPLGYVSGVVTLNGEPMSGVNVIFHPIEGGRQSNNWTDESGHYELFYMNDEKGCVVGDHEVYLSTIDPNDESGEKQVQRVPAKYLGRGKFSATVKKGQNTIDFKLRDD